MSRKTNNLKRQLAIRLEMTRKILAQKNRETAEVVQLRNTVAELTNKVTRLEDEIRVHGELQYLTVNVPPPNQFEMYQLVITFQPEAFLYGARQQASGTREFENLSRMIYNVGRDAQYKVERKMQEVLSKQADTYIKQR